jgi:uncharacterized protein YbbC (DUF1343 family)
MNGRDHGVRMTGRGLLVLSLTAALACAQPPRPGEGAAAAQEVVRPGITVLMEDSLALLAGKRVALLTNQTGVDARGVSDVDLLQRDPRATAAGVTLVRIFSPEHGIRGTEDRTGLPDVRDERSGLMVHSLYQRETMPPPDSLLRDLDALVFDLQDIGTRTWTYVGVMVYAMRAAARVGIPFIVLDRPNPLGGRMDGPLLDAALANPDDPTPERRGQAYALYPAPLRHGMTMGELARFFAAELQVPVRLHVIPMSGWRRSQWWDDTGLPWVVPSPAMVSLASATLYPSLVAFEGSNVSVGRGTAQPFQRFGAPWMDAPAVVRALEAQGVSGVRFEAERFTPEAPMDGKYGGRGIPGVRIRIEDRDRIQSGRLGAAILAALVGTGGDSLRLTARTFDLRFGSATAREALLAGEDPDAVIDRTLPDVVEFQRRVRGALLYR